MPDLHFARSEKLGVTYSLVPGHEIVGNAGVTAARWLSITLALIGCGAGAAVGPLAIADSVAYACTAVLTPGADDEGVIANFAPGPNGLMAWTTGDTELRIGSTIDHSVKVGRAGEGPGEFTMIEQIGWSGDTLWATDLMQARIQYFDQNGKVLGGHRLPPGGGWRHTSDGEVIAIGSRPIGASGWSVLRMTGDSSAPTADTLFHFPGPDSRIVNLPLGDGSSMMTGDPFLPMAQVGAAVDGSLFCGSEPLEGDRTRIRCIDAAGTIIRDTVVTLSPVPLTDAIWTRVVDGYVRGEEARRPGIEAQFTRPASLPRVTALGVDRDGSLWIDRSWYGEPVQRWLRLAPDGSPRDTLVLTRGYIAYLSGDTLWRNWSDGDGMQSVERCVTRNRR